MSTPEDEKPEQSQPFLPTAEETNGPIALARAYAALSVSFDPGQALAASGAEEFRTRMVVAASLSSVCQTTSTDGQWRMRIKERDRILRALDEQGTLAKTIAWREAQPGLDDASRDLTDALCARNRYSAAMLDMLIGNPSISQDVTELQRMAQALRMVASASPVQDRLAAVLAAATAAAAANAKAHNPLLEHGVVGRGTELEKLLAHCRRSWAGEETRPLFIGGIGGVGKSTLMAETLNRLGADRPVVVHLDFDRTGLDENDAVGLAIEVVRQVELALGAKGASFRTARMRAAGSISGRLKRQRTTPPTDLLQTMADAIRNSGRKVLMVIDTMEVLAARGDENPRTLFRSIDAYRAAGLTPVAIIVAGRGAPPPLIAKRMSKMTLLALPDAAARLLLERLKVPDGAWQMLMRLAKGNPLVLRLGARLVADAGTEALRSSGLTRDAVSEQVMAGQLYRLILSRLPEQDLRAIAHPGLLLRRLNAELIREVIAPAVGLDGMTPESANTLFRALGRHAWLVDVDGGWASHRQDLREVLLPLQLAADPPLARRLNRSAAAWFAKRPEPWAMRESLYHRLQSLGNSGPLPSIDPGVARELNDTMLAELTDRARDAVRFARGERTDFGRAGTASARSARDISRAAGEAEMLLGRGNVSEAAGFVDRAVDFDSVDPLSADADVLLEVCWRGGDWERARRLLIRRDKLAPYWRLPEQPTRAAAQMQLRAEFMPRKVRIRLRRDAGLARDLGTLLSDSQHEGIGGPLAWLLLAEGYDAPRSDETAVWHIWSRGDREVNALSQVLRAKLERAGADAAPNDRALSLTHPIIQRTERDGGVPSSLSAEEHVLLLRLLAVGSPYMSIVSERFKQRLWEKHTRRIEAVSALFSDGLLDGVAASTGAVSGPFAIERIDNRGRLAEWLQVLSWLEPKLDLRLIARAAEWRQRTVAGGWAYGIEPRTWRGAWPYEAESRHRCYLDAHLLHRLDRLFEDGRPESMALETLKRWGALLPGESAPLDRLLKRLGRELSKVPRRLFGLHSERARRMAAELVTVGVPVVLLPDLAVYLTRTSASIGPSLTPDQ